MLINVRNHMIVMLCCLQMSAVTHMYMYIQYDISVIQRINSCTKPRITTHCITFYVNMQRLDYVREYNAFPIS